MLNIAYINTLAKVQSDLILIYGNTDDIIVNNEDVFKASVNNTIFTFHSDMSPDQLHEVYLKFLESIPLC